MTSELLDKRFHSVVRNLQILQLVIFNLLDKDAICGECIRKIHSS